MPRQIPFNRPTIVGSEVEHIREAVESGHSSSGGPMSAAAASVIREIHSASEVLLTTSCTDALELAAMMLGIGPGDSVIVPSFTFTSTALAFARNGADLKFCDIDPMTLGLDAASVESLIDPKVKAIVTVHYAGVPSAPDALRKIADRYGIHLVEDNAHGLFGTHDGRPLGTFGTVSTLSFHETKNIVCGEGGALVINDPSYVDFARTLYEKGTNRHQFMDGLVDKYTWVSLGSSFALSEILAAFLLGQLEKRTEIQAARRRVWEGYWERLAPKADDLGISMPYQPANATPSDHMFYVLCPDSVQRSSIISRMRADDVNPTFHYVPLHSSPAGTRYSSQQYQLPVTDAVAGRLLRLPFYNTLTEVDLDRVVDSFVGAIEAERRISRAS